MTEAIHLTCTSCGADFRVKPEAAGRSVRCPECREQMGVPVAEAALRPAPQHQPSPVIDSPRMTAGGSYAVAVVYSLLIVAVLIELALLLVGFAASTSWAVAMGSCIVGSYALARACEKLIRAMHRL